MSDNYPLRFSEAIAYLLCIVVSTAMIWLLLLSIFEQCDPCTKKNGGVCISLGILFDNCLFEDQTFVYAISARVEKCSICSLISKKYVKVIHHAIP